MKFKVLAIASLALIASVVSSKAAVVVSTATGNFTSTSTWALINADSYLNDENATVSVLTANFRDTRSSTFTITGGTLTATGIGVKIAVHTANLGDMSVSLRDAVVNLDDFVAGTSVTINTADLAPSLQADLTGGWVFFKFAAPVSLSNTKQYNVQAKTSNATQVSLWCNATVDNIARAIVTSSATVPGTGDDIIIAGYYSGPFLSSSVIVTMDETRNIDYGSGSIQVSTPAIAVCAKSTFTWATSKTTNLLVSGNIVVYSSAVMSMGTVGNPIPRTSTATLTFDCNGNVDFGLTVRSSGTFIAQGQSRTAGKDVYKCKLNSDRNTVPAKGATILVDTDTGWLTGDAIGVASTSRSPLETERMILANDAVASSMTMTQVFNSTHSGTGNFVAEVVLLNRNVIIQSTSAVSCTYVDIRPVAQFNADWVQFSGMGSATALKRGINIATIDGSTTLDYCVFRSWEQTNAAVFVIGSTSNNYHIRNCVAYGVFLPLINSITSGTNWTVSNYIAMASTGATNIVLSFADMGGTINNITAVGNSSTGNAIQLFEAAVKFKDIQGIVSHSNSGSGLVIQGGFNFTISTVTIWRNNTNTGMILINNSNIKIENLRMFGNLTSNIQVNSGKVIIDSCTISGDSQFPTTNGLVNLASTGGSYELSNCSFGVVSGSATAHTNDLSFISQSFSDFNIQNSTLASVTELAGQTLMFPGTVVTSQKHDQVAGSHKTWKREGTISTERLGSLFDVTPAVRMTPILAAEKLTSTAFRSAVTSGNSLTVTVKVRESIAGDGTDYNGNRIRLLVRENDAIGVSSDTVIATASISSEGAYETLTGTTVSATDDGVMEFMLDCDGTTGWIDYDTFTVASQQDSKSMKYWLDGQPFGYGDNSAGSGGGASSYMFVGQ